MIPVTKLVSLTVKLFTKPVVNYFKSSFKKAEITDYFVRDSLVSLGQWNHRTYAWMVRLNLPAAARNTPIRPLSEPNALENGIEFLGEVAAYSFVLGYGLYELNKLSKDSKLKEEAQQAKIIEMNLRLAQLAAKVEFIKANFNQIADSAKEVLRQPEL